MLSMADPELTKAFAEHHAKVIETNQNMLRAQQQIEELKMTDLKSQVTHKEVSSLPDGIRVYESLGRLFILTATDEVKAHLIKGQEDAKEKIKSLQKEMEVWERNLKQSEDSVRELVSQKRK